MASMLRTCLTGCSEPTSKTHIALERPLPNLGEAFFQSLTPSINYTDKMIDEMSDVCYITVKNYCGEVFRCGTKNLLLKLQIQ